MTSIKKCISTTFLGVAITLSGMAPTMAAPIHIPAPQNVIETGNPVLQVGKRYGRKYRRGIHRGRYNRHGVRRGGYYRGRGYYRGHRHHRRSRNVVPYIVGGIIIGGILFQSQQQYRNHVAWCDRRYRSYSVRSDTYQPYNGPRRRCNSPYR